MSTVLVGFINLSCFCAKLLCKVDVLELSSCIANLYLSSCVFQVVFVKLCLSSYICQVVVLYSCRIVTLQSYTMLPGSEIAQL